MQPSQRHVFKPLPYVGELGQRKTTGVMVTDSGYVRREPLAGHLSFLQGRAAAPGRVVGLLSPPSDELGVRAEVPTAGTASPHFWDTPHKGCTLYSAKPRLPTAFLVSSFLVENTASAKVMFSPQESSGFPPKAKPQACRAEAEQPEVSLPCSIP